MKMPKIKTDRRYLPTNHSLTPGDLVSAHAALLEKELPPDRTVSDLLNSAIQGPPMVTEVALIDQYGKTIATTRLANPIIPTGGDLTVTFTGLTMP